MRSPRFLPILLAVLAGCSSLFAASFRLAAPISDHMVIQREKPVAVWGWADAGESVTVAFAGQSKTATADADGKWMLKLDALKASAEPRTLVVSGKDGHKLEVKDVLVGEVWLGSGQSNMAMTVQSSNNFAAEKTAANFPLIRHYQESSTHAEQPKAEGKGAWKACTPDNVGSFSAVLYFFGREIHKEVGVPVGLINTSVGGTPIESWVSAETQTSDPETKSVYDNLLKTYQGFDAVKATTLYEKQLAAWKIATAKAKAEKADLPRKPFEPIASRNFKGGPAGLYNGKVANLAPYTLRGMLWYQGEGNAGAAAGLYHKQLSQLVTSWRTLWNDEVPFAWVQLPNYTSPGEGWPRVRESMMKTLELPKTGMAITIDLGDAKDIHPKNKQDVGKRLSFWALGTVYGKNVAAISGPLPAGSSISGNAITVSFKHTNGGLKSMNGAALTGFQIAGEDKQWKAAEAKIVGETVVVSSAEVTQPAAVRYAWKDWPEYSLANGASLPASPFRTDDWPVPVAAAPKGKK
jgi:sialate O-acetylesterase